MKNLTIIKSDVRYKDHQIIKVKNRIGQQFDIVLGVVKLFASTADAKRYLRGEETIYEIKETCRTQEYYDEAKKLFNEAMMALVRGDK